MQGDLQSYKFMCIQDIASQVCRRWRNFALAIPTLWGYIYVSDPPPHPKARLYISRSGSCLLDIQTEMKASYLEPEDELYFDSGKQAERALQTLRLIVEYGGAMNCWKSLIVRSKAARPLYDVIGLINLTPIPALRFLSVTWGCDHRNRASPPPNSPEHQATRDAEGKTSNSYSLSCCPHRPHLVHVELVELPCEFTFRRSSPISSSLTRLKLASSFPNLESISNLLFENLRLELLEIDIRTVSLEDPRERLDSASLDRLRVSLPLLRVFSLKIWRYQMCGLQLLKIIDAPNVEDFELEYVMGKGDAIYFRDRQNWEIPTYLAKGRVHGSLQSLTLPTEDLERGLIFPRVRRLNVGNISAYEVLGQPETFADLLSAFPDITYLVAGGQCINTMSEDPNTHIELRHITFRVNTYREGLFCESLELIAEYALSREKIGLPISTLLIHADNPKVFSETLQSKAYDSEVVDKIVGKGDWPTEDSVIILYSSVDTLVVQIPELHCPDWLMDIDYREIVASNGENDRDTDSTGDEAGFYSEFEEESKSEVDEGSDS
ncbi:hypothetical protein B0J17DRAFT_50342 [Rhizoctonia solani]|nr:hypothetical protein B0J17DRAFT_50342 [Rhizoctonia solani]